MRETSATTLQRSSACRNIRDVRARRSDPAATKRLDKRNGSYHAAAEKIHRSDFV